MSLSSPGPWVDYDAIEDTPWTSNDGIVKFIEFPVRIQAMSRRGFHLYWQRHHSPHVMNATAFSQFMRKYTTSHVYPVDVTGLPAHFTQVPQFEGAAEVWVNSVEAAAGWLSHPLYAELIQPDEPRFIDQGGGVEVLLAKEQRLYESGLDMTETGLTKLFVLTRRKTGLAHDAFNQAAGDYGRAILEQPSLRRLLKKLVVSHRLRDPYPNWMPPADIDAVVEMWFTGKADLRAFFDAPIYAQKVRPTESDVFDIAAIRALVAKLHVVHDEFSFQPSTMQPIPFDWDD